VKVVIEPIYFKYKQNQFTFKTDRICYETGKIYGIIGFNGSGKSTFLKILSGVLNVDGFQPFDTQTLSFLQAHLGLFDTTVLKNLKYPLEFRKMPVQTMNEKVEELSKIFDIDALLNQNVNNLSSGQRQKVAIARALIYEPEILMLDEPTANIDPSFILNIEAYLKNYVNAKSATSFMVTHSISQAKRICDELWFFDKGKLLERGKTTELIFNPKSDALKKYLEIEYM